MRLVTLVAIALPWAGLLTLPHIVQSATPGARDVVVDVEEGSPLAQPRQQTRPARLDSPSAPTAFPSFNSQQLDRQVQRYVTYVKQYGVPDILIVGSSRALQGVDPLTLQQVLQQQGWAGLTVYNFGINGATAQVVDWVLHHLLPAEHRPRLIIWADGSRAFNSGRIDHTFNKIVTSAGHQKLIAGVRPQIPVPSALKLGQVCLDLLPVPLSAPAIAPPDIKPAQDCQRSVKIVLRQASTSPVSKLSSPSSEAFGFQVVSTQFHPVLYFQRYPRVRGDFDADYRDFTLNGRQRVALERVSQWANRRKIPLVIVNLPLTTTYLDFSRSLYENRFRGHMQRLSRTHRFTLIDLAPIQTLSQNHYFADPSHLNQAGARAVATQLGQILSRLRVLPSGQTQDPLPWQTRSLSSLLPVSQLTVHLVPGRV